MNVVLWIVQVLLGVAFLAHGWLFLAPPPEIAVQMNATLPRWFQLFMGVAEVAAAVGLTLPGLTRILPWLVTWAAVGVMIVTVSATAFHLMRGELSSAATTLVLLALAAFVAYMRHRVVPIGARRATENA
jgi:putative oxidoreductase